MQFSYNLAYAKALPIVLGEFSSIEFSVVGCGGTGGFLVSALARLMLALEATGVSCSSTLIDYDRVEEKNVPRQNFTAHEIGSYKAQSLACRYSFAYGIKLWAICAPFSAQMVRYHSPHTLSIVVGCVDNNRARREIARVLDETSRFSTSPRIWWLDCGNFGYGVPGGQVLLGSCHEFTVMASANDPDNPSFLHHLPSPSLQHPELLEDEGIADRKVNPSCAEIAQRDAQAIFINQRVATEAIEMLSQLVLTRNLKRFATYFNLQSGSTQSEYTDLETLRRFS